MVVGRPGESSLEVTGLVPTFINGYFRITRLGELNECRHVTTEETDAVLNSLLMSSYRPSFLPKSADVMKWNARRQWAKNLLRPVWFKGRRLLRSGRLNYHYWVSDVISRQFISSIPQTYKGCDDRELMGMSAATLKVPQVYFPLQMSPEATVDYWSAAPNWVWYEKAVLKIIDQHKETVRFLVKEHPNVLGMRSVGFYRHLSARKNVCLVSPSVPSNDVVDKCEAIVICTGTAGFESMLRGIPVFSDSAPWHLSEELVKPISDIDTGFASTSITQTVKVAAVRRLLRGLLPGDFNNNGTWEKSRPDQTPVAQSISEALPFLRFAS